MKKFLGLASALLIAGITCAQTYSITLTPDQLRMQRFSCNATTNATAYNQFTTNGVMTWVNDTAGVALLPMVIVQDLSVVTNTVTVTYKPAGSANAFSCGTNAAVAGSEALTVLSNYPIARYGDTYIFTSSTTGLAATNVTFLIEYSRFPSRP